MTRKQNTPIEISKDEFKRIGHQLIDSIADFLDGMDKKPVTTGESLQELQKHFNTSSLPENGRPAKDVVSEAATLLMNHSLLNGHPRFMGYITSSPAPIGMLADLLAAAVNPNVGAQILSPVATEIEKQTIKWLAEFIGVAGDYDGILVSGGNMANFTAFLAARTAKAPENIKEKGLTGASKSMIIYCSKTTHTWVEKAAVLFGHGSSSIRWIQTDSKNRMDNKLLEQAINEDLQKGHQPFIVIGTAGDVSTGVVDDLKGIAAICKSFDLWFHIDGAYGIPAAAVPELTQVFQGTSEADSIALDPHKWLFSPLEAGCTLVKNSSHLTDAFSSHPEYYNFNNNENGLTRNYYEYGLQNSRGFRALKVWLALQQVGKSGYVEMIREEMELSQLLFELAANHAELEAITRNLSITTFRYVPADGADKNETWLNTLNENLLNALQNNGEAFLSNASVNGKYCLRACIVNFRTSPQDIEEIVEIVVREGRKVYQELMQKS